MNDLNRILIVVCEGASEKAYIQELNRFFREEDIPLHIIPRPSDGGAYSKVISKYKEVRKDNHKAEILIWVDYDRYARNDRGDMDRYHAKPADIPDFLFSKFNFEDILSMHLEKPFVNKWISICVAHNHFSTPMCAITYEVLFKDLVGGSYQKGEIPFVIDRNHLENLIANLENDSIPFDSDFHRYILNYLKK